MNPALLVALLPVRGWVAVGVTALTVGFVGYRIGVLVGDSSGYSRGYEAGEQDEYRKWANFQSEAMEQAQAALAEATVRYTAEVERSQELQRTLAVTRSRAAKLKREKEDAIRQYVSDRRQCLSADAVRVLNDQSENPGGVSNDAAATGTGTAGGTATGAAASEGDVARWVIDAREQYANCAAQVNAWVRWYQGTVR